MKILKMSQLIMVGLLCNLITIQAMEAPGKEYTFLKTSISDIQNLARDISQDTGNSYQIVTAPALVERCLQILGLTTDNTPLDIRYHYDLLMQKLPKDDPAYTVVTKVYNQLIGMLLIFDSYKEELAHLLAMSIEQVEKMELEDKVINKYQFIRHKDRLISNTINVLKKTQRQYVFNRPIDSSTAIKELLRLPMEASRGSIERNYDRYMEKNSFHKLIALKKIKNISIQDMKTKMLEREKVKEAYAHYLKENQ